MPNRLRSPWIVPTALVMVVGVSTLAWSGSGWVSSASHHALWPALAGVAAAAPPTQSTGDDATPTPPQRRSGLIGALRDQITGSPVLEEAGAVEGLLEQLDAADTLFQDAKRRNREALRRLNRGSVGGTSRSSLNLVVIVLDHLPPEAFDADRGPPELKTLQSLARQGSRIGQAYAGSADAETSFWSLMTGRNTGRLPSGVSTTTARDADLSLASLLWDAGYATACSGYWPGETNPTAIGFDFWSGVTGSDAPVTLYPERLSLNRSTMRVSDNADGQESVSLWKLLEMETAGWIGSAAAKENPFFLLVRLPDPASRSEGGAPSAETLRGWDGVVQGLLATLRSQNSLTNTGIIVTSLTPGRSQSSSADDSIGLRERELRVPFAFLDPSRRSRDAAADQVVALWDVLPTLLDLAGVRRRPTEIDGRSMLTTATTSGDRVLYWRSPGAPDDQAVRKGDWKAIYSAKHRRLQLFDLASDPDESDNVAAKHPEIVEQLLFGPPDAVKSTLEASQR